MSNGKKKDPDKLYLQESSNALGKEGLKPFLQREDLKGFDSIFDQINERVLSKALGDREMARQRLERMAELGVKPEAVTQMLKDVLSGKMTPGGFANQEPVPMRTFVPNPLKEQPAMPFEPRRRVEQLDGNFPRINPSL